MRVKCSNKSKARSWASEQLSLIKRKSLTKLIGLLISGLTRLTRTKRKILLKNIGKTILLFANKTRLRAIKNITNAMPELSLKEATDLAFDAYGNCAFGVAESFWLTEIEPEIFCDEDTLRILQSGEGACIATMHMGCYEAVPLAVTKFANQSVTLTNIPAFIEKSMDFYSNTNITAINKKSANAFTELLSSNELTSWRGEGRANQGLLALEQNQVAKAEQAFLGAITVEPYFDTGYINLADLYRTQQRSAEVASVLSKGMKNLPNSGALKYAYGLHLVRTQQHGKALGFFEQATIEEPQSPQYLYAFILSLDGQGETVKAVNKLQKLIGNYSDKQQLKELGLYLAQKSQNRQMYDWFMGLK